MFLSNKSSTSPNVTNWQWDKISFDLFRYGFIKMEFTIKGVASKLHNKMEFLNANIAIYLISHETYVCSLIYWLIFRENSCWLSHISSPKYWHQLYQIDRPTELSKPDYKKLKVFGCLCYAKNMNIKNKIYSHSRPSIFIDYPFNDKGLKIHDMKTKDIFISRDVHFHEDLFPFQDAHVLMLSTSQNENPVLINLIKHTH